jgi:hypothetical protein
VFIVSFLPQIAPLLFGLAVSAALFVGGRGARLISQQATRRFLAVSQQLLVLRALANIG